MVHIPPLILAWLFLSAHNFRLCYQKTSDTQTHKHICQTVLIHIYKIYLFVQPYKTRTHRHRKYIKYIVQSYLVDLKYNWRQKNYSECVSNKISWIFMCKIFKFLWHWIFFSAFFISFYFVPSWSIKILWAIDWFN